MGRGRVVRVVALWEGGLIDFTVAGGIEPGPLTAAVNRAERQGLTFVAFFQLNLKPFESYNPLKVSQHPLKVSHFMPQRCSSQADVKLA